MKMKAKGKIYEIAYNLVVSGSQNFRSYDRLLSRGKWGWRLLSICFTNPLVLESYQGELSTSQKRGIYMKTLNLKVADSYWIQQNKIVCNVIGWIFSSYVTNENWSWSRLLASAPRKPLVPILNSSHVHSNCWLILEEEKTRGKGKA